MPGKNTLEEGNLYDKIFKENLEELILPMLKPYWQVEVKSMKRLRNKLQTTTEREADFLSEITDSLDRKFLLHVEFQSKDDPEMVYRIQEYHGIISRKYQLPIQHFVFYFGSSPSKMHQQLSQEILFQGFQLLDFQSIDHRDLLLSEAGSEIVLAILADFKEKDPEAVIRMILQRLKVVSKSENELKKYFSQLNVLSRLRNLSEETIKNISAMPITIDVEKDYLYRKGKEQGLEQGMEQGLKKGEHRGEAKKTFEATANMLKLGLEISIICQALHVTPEYVEEVRRELDL